MSRLRAVRAPVQELISAVQHVRFRWLNAWTAWPASDVSTSDYAFWDRARRCKAKGLELSGLFLRPINSKIAAWAMGERPAWKSDNPAAAQALNEWWATNHADILFAYEEALSLGDFFLIVNSDLSLTLVPPHIVEPVVDDANYGSIIGWKIIERIDHPTQPGQSMVITNTYTARERVVTTEANGAATTRRYRNLIGLVPVVHVVNRRGAGEMFGRPEAEALVPLLQRYGAVLDAGLKGNIRQGRPTPTIENLGDDANVQAFWNRYGRTETQTMPDGTTQTTTVVDFDADQLLTLGGTGTFKYASPNPFATDSEKFLGLLFYLLIEGQEIPEFIMGNAINSSKASAEAQMPPFVRFIDKKRGMAEKWMLQIAQLVLAYTSVFDRAVNAADQTGVQWSTLTEQDGRLTLESVKYAYNSNLLPADEALSMLPLAVDDPVQSVARAQAEAEAQRDAEADRIQHDIERLSRQSDDQDEAA